MVAAKSSRVNRQYKKKYRIRNWREYERGLRSRGDVTIWLSEDAIAAWVPPKNGLRGGQRRYSNLGCDASSIPPRVENPTLRKPVAINLTFPQITVELTSCVDLFLGRRSTSEVSAARDALRHGSG